MDDDLVLCSFCGRALDAGDPHRLVEVPDDRPGGAPWVAVVCLGCFLARRTGGGAGEGG
jgi:hypothetical protein